MINFVWRHPEDGRTWFYNATPLKVALTPLRRDSSFSKLLKALYWLPGSYMPGVVPITTFSSVRGAQSPHIAAFVSFSRDLS